MINFSGLILNLETASYLFLFKILILVLELFYTFFAFINVRQVSLMNKSFKTEVGGFFSLLAYLHLFACLGLIFLSVVVL